MPGHGAAAVVVAVALVLGVAARPPPSASTGAARLPDVAVGVPLGLVRSALEAFGAPLIKAAVANISIPTTCCYDDVGADHVHLDLSNLALTVQDVKVSASALPASIGPYLNFTASVPVTVAGFERLCLHDDPFGHGCSTLYHCKGDFKLEATVVVTLIVDLGANAAGNLTANVTGEAMRFAHSSFDICDKLKDEVEGILPTAFAKLDKALPALAETAINSVLAGLPPSVAVPGLLDVAPHYTAGGTALSPYGAGVSASLAITAAKTKAASPLLPATNISLPAFNDTLLHVRVADSALGNALYALNQDGLLVFSDRFNNSEVGFNVSVAPLPTAAGLVVAVSPGAGIAVKMTAVLNASADLADVTFSVPFNANFSLLANLSNPNASAVGVVFRVADVEFRLDNCTGVCKLLNALLQAAVPTLVADLNTKLEATALWVSVRPPLAVSGAALRYGTRALEFAAAVSIDGPAAVAVAHRLPGPRLSAIACPTIPKAHPDKCI